MLTGGFWRLTECCGALEDIMGVSLKKNLANKLFEPFRFEKKANTVSLHQSAEVARAISDAAGAHSDAAQRKCPLFKAT